MYKDSSYAGGFVNVCIAACTPGCSYLCCRYVLERFPFCVHNGKVMFSREGRLVHYQPTTQADHVVVKVSEEGYGRVLGDIGVRHPGVLDGVVLLE